MSGTRLGIGLIGAGRHGLRYAKHLADGIPGLRLAGIARRDASQVRALAGQLGCEAFSDYGELLAAPGVHAAAVVVPPSLHPPIVEAAARAGKPVLLEKPAAVGLAAGRRMLDAVREAGIPVMVAQTMRYNEAVAAVRQALGELGPLHALRISLRFEPSPLAWVTDPAQAGGGVMLHTGVHGFDLLRYLGGMEADRVSAETGRVQDASLEDNFSAVLRLEGGRAIGSVSGCRATASRTGAIEVVGERGQIVADHVLRTAWIVRGGAAEILPLPGPVSTVAAVLADFARVAAGTLPNPIPLVDGLRSVALVEAAYAAAREGRSMPVDPVAIGPGEAGDARGRSRPL